jgi:hypothetical protein
LIDFEHLEAHVPASERDSDMVVPVREGAEYESKTMVHNRIPGLETFMDIDDYPPPMRNPM